MDLTQAVQELADISVLQARIIVGLHVEQWPIGAVAHSNKITVHRVQAEEAAGFRNLVEILLGKDAFAEAHEQYLETVKAGEAKAKKKRGRPAGGGDKAKSETGPSETQS